MIIAQQLLHHRPKKLTYANFIGPKDFIINIKVIFHGPYFITHKLLPIVKSKKESHSKSELRP